ncbi:MAG: metallopeptidase family protein, partial [Proteobacteria bacterium]|nr:metallopeptidase family protein [Pseudomonadota bacterium]
MDQAVWRGAKAPSLDDFEAIAHEAYSRLPEGFRRMTAGVIIRIADFPDEEIVEEMDLESPFDILGLFQGIGMAQAAATMETGQFPNMIWLYRRPILDYWAD